MISMMYKMTANSNHNFARSYLQNLNKSTDFYEVYKYELSSVKLCSKIVEV